VELPAIVEPTLRFLREIGYYGLAEVEYKLDPRDGKYKLLDVNARTWGFHALGRPSGVDFCYLLFADQIGEAVVPCHGRPGVGWIRMVTDIPTSVIGMLHGRLNLNSYSTSLWNMGVESVFSQEDVLPSLAEIALLPYLAVKRGF
jgi:D-aspartate ligase